MNTGRSNRAERILARVDVDRATGCWIWRLVPTTAGYGLLWTEGRRQLAHRVSYEAFVGPIPDGLTLDHLCRNRVCVNPAHLEPVTNRVNILRGNTLPAANAAKTHCPQDHSYDEANTRYYRGKRNCRACANARNHTRKAVSA